METMTICPTSYETILACRRIARAFRENIFELSSIRKDWDSQFANSLQIWIDDVFERDYAGYDDELDQEKFENWHEIMIAGLQNLKILRACVKVDFKNDKAFQKEFFTVLGYNEYYTLAKSGDHRSLYRFLTQFSENLSDEIRRKVTSKKTRDSLFVKILDFASQIQKFKHCFEVLESDAVLNVYEQKEVNQIYETIKDICTIAAAYYDFDPEKRNQFSFYKVVVNV
jgi:hypothetical protein